MLIKLRSYHASQVISQFRLIEGGNEAGFQAILTLVFLIQTNFNGANTITITSFVASVLSLASRLSVIDTNCLKKEARKLKDIEASDFIKREINW